MIVIWGFLSSNSLSTILVDLSSMFIDEFITYIVGLNQPYLCLENVGRIKSTCILSTVTLSKLYLGL